MARFRTGIAALGFAAVVASGPSGPAVSAQEHNHDTGLRSDPEGCREPTLKCASYATPFFDGKGRLWLAWSANGQVAVAFSADAGATFSAPALVTPKPLRLDNGPDERPQIVVDKDGRVIVAFAIFKDDKMNGQVFTAVSSNGGKTFSAPQSITDDGSSQRFITLSLDPTGDLFATWIDKRHVVAARTAGKAFPGASLAFAWSRDGGATFDAARIAHDNMCECCRLGVALAGPHRPVVLFRNVFKGERDHAVMTFADGVTPGPVSRVSEDHWAIDACPHHGPSLSVAEDGSYHASWWSGGGVRQGAFYARSTDGGKTFSEPMALADVGHRATRPYVRTLGRDVWLAWKEFDGERTTVLVRESHDLGVTWSAPRVAADTSDFSDHPLLVSDGKRVYLSWLTRVEGYRLIRLGGLT